MPVVSCLSRGCITFRLIKQCLTKGGTPCCTSKLNTVNLLSARFKTVNADRQIMEAIGSPANNTVHVLPETSSGFKTKEVDLKEIVEEQQCEMKPTVRLSRREKKRMKREALKQSWGAPKKKNKQNNDIEIQTANLNDTDYYFENGLRKVHPYYFKFFAYAKGRWLNRTLQDVFTKEFRFEGLEHVLEIINSGRMTVNGKQVSPDYKIQNQDILQNSVHRHEVPVSGEKINVIFEDDDVFVVDKPSSIPVHPCGRYRFNSITYILAKEWNKKELRTAYRLDRLTSGLLILLKNRQKANEFAQLIKNRKVEKEYVCRVDGEFPSEVVECKEPMDVLSYKLGVQRVISSGKEAHTTFQRLSYNGKSSVVSCKPHTGRTHQIRVHLQYLGFPIINDPLYNHPLWGQDKGKWGQFGRSDEEVVKDLLYFHSNENFLDQTQEDGSDRISAHPDTETSATVAHIEYHPNAAKACELGSKNEKSLLRDSCSEEAPDCKRLKLDTVSESSKVLNCSEPLSNPGYSLQSDIPSVKPVAEKHDSDETKVSEKTEVESSSRDPNCRECRRKYRDPSPAELVLFLHALRYKVRYNIREVHPQTFSKGPGFDYSTKLPLWAAADWKEDLS